MRRVCLFLLSSNITSLSILLTMLGHCLGKCFPTDSQKIWVCQNKNREQFQAVPYCSRSVQQRFLPNRKFHTFCSVPSSEDATDQNIGNLLLTTRQPCNIPLSNWLALSAENPPLMLGMKSGVAAEKEDSKYHNNGPPLPFNKFISRRLKSI
ncbi:hypothetical protein PR048_006224 [Dryococelus australis]|uniref:Secreted protein n=1 Tax=Dryococelus australis TaxID=614101 RepID=A0ABQ9IAD8_9NEOP|nr:hypothetical protein PR048_006224 [Dryococelus australis]